MTCREYFILEKCHGMDMWYTYTLTFNCTFFNVTFFNIQETIRHLCEEI